MDIEMKWRPSNRFTRRWHVINSTSKERTDAMNVGHGALVRSRVECVGGDSDAIGMSMVFVPDLVVVQQWHARMAGDDSDSESPKYIEVSKMVYLDRASYLIDDGRHNGHIINGRFRRFSADDEMPKPEDSIIRATISTSAVFMTGNVTLGLLKGASFTDVSLKSLLMIRWKIKIMKMSLSKMIDLETVKSENGGYRVLA